VPPGSVPSRVESLSGLPPAWIGVGALDLFVGEDMEYARRLIEAGSPAHREAGPGAFHGVDITVPGAGVSARFTESWRAALQRAFAGT
jgi:acetyl esterase/lipase